MKDKTQTAIFERERDLKRKWLGKADNVPVNSSQYSFDTAEREQRFIDSQFSTEEQKARYRQYREEWYRRAKELDPGNAPLAVCCELVSTCNLGCSMCYTVTEEFQSSVVGKSRMLPWNVVTAIIDECAELGIPSILFSWRGESSIYRQKSGDKVYDFADVLAYARKKEILEISALTHGQMISKALAEKIVDAEPSWISFSIDGLGDVYNKIRTPPHIKTPGYDAFAEVTNTIRDIVRIRDEQGKRRPQIRTNTIFPAIARNSAEYHDFMQNLGVGWITVNEILDFRGEDIPLANIIADWACQYPFQRLTISANGTILPCTGAHNEEEGLVLGRYLGSPGKTFRSKNAPGSVDNPELNIATVWKSEKLENIRNAHRENRRQEIHPGCRHCRHGAVKHGVDWIPDDWDMVNMEWKGGVWRE